MAVEDEEFMLANDVARAAGISRSALAWHELKDALVPAARTPSGVRLFRRADVERWLQARRDGQGTTNPRTERVAP